MIEAGSRIFFQFPSESASRILHAGTISEAVGSGFMVVMDEPELPAAAGEESFIFFENKREFMQQPVSVDAVLTLAEYELQMNGEDADSTSDDADTEDVPSVTSTDGTSDDTSPNRILIGFQPVGEAVSAESRQCYRTLTSLSSNVTAIIDNDFKCPVMDVSATGFSVLSETPLKIGQVVRLVLLHEKNEFDGSAVIQSTKEQPDGRVRYGLYCAGDEKTNGTLFKGLRQIGTIIQRQQIRRMSGAV